MTRLKVETTVSDAGTPTTFNGNVNSTTPAVIYTVPTGKTFRISSFWFELFSASGVATGTLVVKNSGGSVIATLASMAVPATNLMIGIAPTLPVPFVAPAAATIEIASSAATAYIYAGGIGALES